jgi:hypothetical protein
MLIKSAFFGKAIKSQYQKKNFKFLLHLFKILASEINLQQKCKRFLLSYKSTQISCYNINHKSPCLFHTAYTRGSKTFLHHGPLNDGPQKYKIKYFTDSEWNESKI